MLPKPIITYTFLHKYNPYNRLYHECAHTDFHTITSNSSDCSVKTFHGWYRLGKWKIKNVRLLLQHLVLVRLLLIGYIGYKTLGCFNKLNQLVNVLLGNDLYLKHLVFNH